MLGHVVDALSTTCSGDPTIRSAQLLGRVVGAAEKLGVLVETRQYRTLTGRTTWSASQADFVTGGGTWDRTGCSDSGSMCDLLCPYKLR